MYYKYVKKFVLFKSSKPSTTSATRPNLSGYFKETIVAPQEMMVISKRFLLIIVYDFTGINWSPLLSASS